MSLRSIIYFLFALGILLFTSLMASIIIQYFPYHHAMLFLSTKSDYALSKIWYLTSFYIHISMSLLSIGLGVFQFMPYMFHNYKPLHKRIGMIYVNSILAFSAPSGFLISFYANGGNISKLGFICLSIFWWVFTWNAFRFAKSKNWTQHIKWMTRSYALTLAAFSLRTEGYLLNLITEQKSMDIYIFLSWFAWIGNLIVAEILLYFSIHKKLYQLFFQTNLSTSTKNHA